MLEPRTAVHNGDDASSSEDQVKTVSSILASVVALSSDIVPNKDRTKEETQGENQQKIQST